MLLGITNGGKLGLGLCAGLLIVFAVLSSFYFPRRNPDYPGKRLGLFIAVAALLFAVTMVGSRRLRGRGGGRTRQREANATETSGSPETTTEEGGAAEGDPAAGEAVFASAGCGGCHTLEGGGGIRDSRTESRRGEAGRCARRRSGHERSGRDAVVRGPAQRQADSRRRCVRGHFHAPLDTARYPDARPERCPSGRRSATGNRVRVERRVAGSNPALSVIAQGRNLPEQIPTALKPLKLRGSCWGLAQTLGAAQRPLTGWVDVGARSEPRSSGQIYACGCHRNNPGLRVDDCLVSQRQTVVGLLAGDEAKPCLATSSRTSSTPSEPCARARAPGRRPRPARAVEGDDRRRHRPVAR